MAGGGSDDVDDFLSGLVSDAEEPRGPLLV